ncbi:MAG: secondary thiamine-phosphate synthase enzyme YjbQ [Commensalibacter sp.]
MKQNSAIHLVQTHGQGLTMINFELASWILKTGIINGLLTIWCCHTSASLIVQENFDPAVKEDILNYFNTIVPEDPHRYRHNSEGLDDMPAHLKSILTQTQLSIPVIDRRMALGEWQGIYLFEHRKQPHQRKLALHIIGEAS